MDISEGIMCDIMKNPLVRTAYFFKDMLLDFMKTEHEHKSYIVRSL